MSNRRNDIDPLADDMPTKFSEWDERYRKVLVERIASYARDPEAKSRGPLKLHIEDIVMLTRTLGGYNIVRLDVSGRGGEVFGVPFELLPLRDPPA